MQTENERKNKGGRPAQKVKMDRVLSVKCTIADKRIIQNKARRLGRTASDYLRNLGLECNIDRRDQLQIDQLLRLKAELSPFGNNINQLAKKKNSGEPFTVLERLRLEEALSKFVEAMNELLRILKR